MKKIKLPRKRKKAFIKAHGYVDYVAATIINEILCERPDHTNKHRSYYDLEARRPWILIYKKKW